MPDDTVSTTSNTDIPLETQQKSSVIKRFEQSVPPNIIKDLSEIVETEEVYIKKMQGFLVYIPLFIQDLQKRWFKSSRQKKLLATLEQLQKSLNKLPKESLFNAIDANSYREFLVKINIHFFGESDNFTLQMMAPIFEIVSLTDRFFEITSKENSKELNKIYRQLPADHPFRTMVNGTSQGDVIRCFRDYIACSFQRIARYPLLFTALSKREQDPNLILLIDQINQNFASSVAQVNEETRTRERVRQSGHATLIVAKNNLRNKGDQFSAANQQEDLDEITEQFYVLCRVSNMVAHYEEIIKNRAWKKTSYLKILVIQNVRRDLDALKEELRNGDFIAKPHQIAQKMIDVFANNLRFCGQLPTIFREGEFAKMTGDISDYLDSIGLKNKKITGHTKDKMLFALLSPLYESQELLTTHGSDAAAQSTKTPATFCANIQRIRAYYCSGINSKKGWKRQIEALDDTVTQIYQCEKGEKALNKMLAAAKETAEEINDAFGSESRWSALLKELINSYQTNHTLEPDKSRGIFKEMSEPEAQISINRHILRQINKRVLKHQQKIRFFAKNIHTKPSRFAENALTAYQQGSLDNFRLSSLPKNCETSVKQYLSKIGLSMGS